jgi:hypothetical protein
VGRVQSGAEMLLETEAITRRDHDSHSPMLKASSRSRWLKVRKTIATTRDKSSRLGRGSRAVPVAARGVVMHGHRPPRHWPTAPNPSASRGSPARTRG